MSKKYFLPEGRGVVNLESKSPGDKEGYPHDGGKDERGKPFRSRSQRKIIEAPNGDEGDCPTIQGR